jgi:rubrerythrin
MKKRMGSRTEHNLMAAFAGESQARNRYTFYAKIASKEGHEKVAATLYKREVPIPWKCAKCGRVHEGTEAPKRCPTCDHPQGWFIPVEANY